MAEKRDSEPIESGHRPEDLAARLRDEEARHQELTAALALAQRQIAFYQSYQVRLQEVIAQALAAAFQAGEAGSGPESAEPGGVPPGTPTAAAQPSNPAMGEGRGASRAVSATEADLVAEVTALEQELSALRAKVAGLQVIPEARAGDAAPCRPPKPSPAPSLIDDLSRRELDVLRLMAQGLGNREIASRLFISEKTVKSHVTSVFGKLQVTDRTQAVLYAVRHGLTD